MRPIVTDTHDFSSLRRDGKIYVDKTMFIQRLVATPDSKPFFLSRPRRSEPYRADGRPIWLVGLTFESSPHCLADCTAVRWNENNF